jgi:hypothetical protein
LIAIDGAAMSEIFEDFVNEFEFGVLAIQEAKCLFCFGLKGLLIIELED